MLMFTWPVMEETVTPVQQVVDQTAVSSIPLIPEEDEAEEAGDALVKPDEEAMALEDQPPQAVPVRSGLEEARLSFVTATVFRDLDKQLLQFGAGQFSLQKGQEMREVLGWRLAGF